MIYDNGKPVKPQELEKIINEAIERAIEKATEKAISHQFELLGVVLHDAKMREQTVDDLKFLRRLRRAVDGAAAAVGKTIVTAIIAGMLSLLWMAFNIKR